MSLSLNKVRKSVTKFIPGFYEVHDEPYIRLLSLKKYRNLLPIKSLIQEHYQKKEHCKIKNYVPYSVIIKVLKNFLLIFYIIFIITPTNHKKGRKRKN